MDITRNIGRLLFAGLLLGSLSVGEARAADADEAWGLLDRLTRMPGQHQVLQASSRNKTGHNGDENYPLYNDKHGDDVIFDAVGPGCIFNIWGTHFVDDAMVNFYFDGEAEPRYCINEIEFYKGNHPAFPGPLNSYDKRGHYHIGLAGNSFIPIPFEKSLKISITGESRFFHIIWEKYPHGAPVNTFTGDEDRGALLDAFDLPADAVAAGDDIEVVKLNSEDVAPDSEVVLFSREGAGVVRSIVLEADGSVEMFRNSEIQMRWDRHSRADVLAPTGMFFACANHACNINTLPVSVQKLDTGRVKLTCRLPMPFWRHGEIIFRNRSDYSLGPVFAEISVSPNDLDPRDGLYFTTRYREGKTSYGRDWRLFQSPGAGWYVGTVQTMQHGHYCEGDEHFYIDGAISPQINGTGSEDYYLACFWPNYEFSIPFAAVAGDVMLEAGGHFFGSYRMPACYGRFHLEAPIPFFSSIDARIQHGGLSHLRSDYRSLAYCYLRRRPALRQTDFIDVGNAFSESAHSYESPGSGKLVSITAHPEGEYFEYDMDEDGRSHYAGEISFTIAIDPDNGGVRLRRRLDQSSPCQFAYVKVNGRYAGSWYHSNHNEHLRWHDSDFDIPSDLTRGKESLEVTLVIDGSPGRGAFTDFRYEVFCFEGVRSED